MDIGLFSKYPLFLKEIINWLNELIKSLIFTFLPGCSHAKLKVLI